MNPFIGTIIMFGFDWAPRGWARCDGALLAISSNEALFSLIGTIYGGDGRTTFALPDLRGRVAMHSGSGPGLTPRTIGAKFGSETNTLTVPQMPSHNHTATVGGDAKLPVSDADADTDSPAGAFLTATSDDHYASAASAGEFAGALLNDITVAVSNNGGGQAVNNMQPYLVVNYCIALEGIYPSRS